MIADIDLGGTHHMEKALMSKNFETTGETSFPQNWRSWILIAIPQKLTSKLIFSYSFWRGVLKFSYHVLEMNTIILICQIFYLCTRSENIEFRNLKGDGMVVFMTDNWAYILYDRLAENASFTINFRMNNWDSETMLGLKNDINHWI